MQGSSADSLARLTDEVITAVDGGTAGAELGTNPELEASTEAEAQDSTEDDESTSE